MIAAVLGPLGAPELIIILVVVVLIFGVGKMADVGGALGNSIREFRKAAREPDGDDDLLAESSADAAPTPTSCSSCGADLAPNARFCAGCGSAVKAGVN